MTTAAPTRPRTTPPAAGAVATSTLAEALESSLAGLIAEHERLTELAKAQRAAISAADSAALESIASEQRLRMRAIAALDVQRHEAAGHLALRYGLGRPGEAGVGGPTVSAIAAAMHGPGAERLRALAERLRSTLQSLQREHAVIRSAAETVFAHIDGMMQQLARKLTQTATYTRPGARAAPVQVASALDLTS